MDLTEGSIKKKIIPNKVLDWDGIKIVSTTLKNDLYEKHQVEVLIQGEMLVCNDISKMKVYSRKIKKETYSEYIDKITTRDPSKDQWIYNIIDGISEQSEIIYRDEKCICILSYTWSGKTDEINKLHMLCFPIDKTLRCIRSLNSSHIDLLTHMKAKSLEVIKSKYNLDITDLKMFFHYDPSTYHLHIHFINVEHIETNSSVEYSHDLDSVIFNLGIDSDYYKKISLNTR
jgi:diadenosine tetraphosphate (Ap4A) HIT family hydrolase